VRDSMEKATSAMLAAGAVIQAAVYDPSALALSRLLSQTPKDIPQDSLYLRPAIR
jgi:hypothetical protein